MTLKTALVLFGIFLVTTLSGCADHVQCAQIAVKEPVGFWYGLWHGMILPFSWVASLFMNDVAIYAIYNNGGWYDFGFILGEGSFVQFIWNICKFLRV